MNGTLKKRLRPQADLERDGIRVSDRAYATLATLWNLKRRGTSDQVAQLMNTTLWHARSCLGELVGRGLVRDNVADWGKVVWYSVAERATEEVAS